MCSAAEIQLEIAQKKIDELQRENKDLWQFTHHVDTYINEEVGGFVNSHLYNLRCMHSFLINHYQPTNEE